MSYEYDDNNPWWVTAIILALILSGLLYYALHIGVKYVEEEGYEVSETVEQEGYTLTDREHKELTEVINDFGTTLNNAQKLQD